MQKLHIILQKHAFCKEKERDKNKNKTKKQRDRLKNCLLFIVKFCCGDDWSAASRQLCRNVQNFQIPDISSWWNVFQSVFWGLWKSRQMMISITIFNSTLPCGVWYECRLPCRGWNCSDSRKRLSWSRSRFDQELRLILWYDAKKLLW